LYAPPTTFALVFDGFLGGFWFCAN